MEEMLKSRYLIREQIGQGAFGVIYHALDEQNDREIAIKVWKAGNETEIFADRSSPFLRDQNFPGIVQIYDYFEKAGMNFLVMEYLPGGTLKQKMDEIRKEKSPKEVLDLFTPVLIGLAFLHSEGLVHCDLSPDNLMFDGDGTLKLIDLGACRGRDIVCEKKFLKESYSAPEQYTDTERIGPWTDVYGLCAVLFEVLTGEKLPSAAERLQKDELRPISVYRKVDRQIEQALMHGLNLEIQQRYFSMELLAHGMGLRLEELEHFSGSTRHFWGQNWIQISGQGIGYHANEQKKSLRVVKRAGIGIAAILLAAGLFYGGDLWLQNHAPVGYFKRKAERTRDAGIAKGDERLISSLDKDYDKILQKLSEYAPEMAEDLGEEGNVSCELTEEELIEWGVPDNIGRKMYLDKDSIKKVLFSQMGLQAENVEIKTEEDCFSTVSRRTDGSYELLRNSSSVTESYQIEFSEAETEYYKIAYDPVDGRVINLYANMSDPERFEIFVGKLLPVCCPESYLEPEEIRELKEQMAKTEDDHVTQVNLHSWLNLYSQIDEENETVQYYVRIAASNAGLFY